MHNIDLKQNHWIQSKIQHMYKTSVKIPHLSRGEGFDGSIYSWMPDKYGT